MSTPLLAWCNAIVECPARRSHTNFPDFELLLSMIQSRNAGWKNMTVLLRRTISVSASTLKSDKNSFQLSDDDATDCERMIWYICVRFKGCRLAIHKDRIFAAFWNDFLLENFKLNSSRKTSKRETGRTEKLLDFITRWPFSIMSRVSFR